MASNLPSERKVRPASLDIDLAVFLNAHWVYLKKFGIEVRASYDFELLASICSDLPNKGMITSIFDPALSDVMPNVGLWLGGYDEDGKLVHVQALRCDNLDWCSLADWWRVNFKRIYRCPMSANQHDVADRISGKVVYQGDFWIDRSIARAQLSPVLGRLAMGIVLSRWAPDFVYGLVVQRLARTGFALNGGYRQQAPYAIDWGTPDAPYERTDYIVYNSYADLVDLVATPLEELF